MKHVLLITVFLVAMATKLMAQDHNAIRINQLQSKSFSTQTLVQKENHQFEIVAHEQVDVNLRFSLKKEDNVDIVVTDEKDRVILTKTLKKEGLNKLAFSMDENEKYIVRVAGDKQSNLIVQLAEE